MNTAVVDYVFKKIYIEYKNFLTGQSNVRISEECGLLSISLYRHINLTIPCLHIV